MTKLFTSEMKLAVFTIILVFLLIIVTPILLTFGIKYLPGQIQPSLGSTQKIYGNQTIFQSFMSPKDNLAGIGVSLKNPNLENKEDVVVNIYDDNRNLIRSATLNGKTIDDGKFVKFLFEPIQYSKDQKFVWSISAKNAPLEKALEVFLTKENPSWILDLRINDKSSDEDLSFVTLHKVSSWKEIIILVYSNLASKLTSDLPFFVIYTLLLISLMIYLGLGLKKAKHK